MTDSKSPNPGSLCDLDSMVLVQRYRDGNGGTVL